jgi:hypothetical protein
LTGSFRGDATWRALRFDDSAAPADAGFAGLAPAFAALGAAGAGADGREAEGEVADGSARGGGITAVATGSAEARASVDMPIVNGSTSATANGSKAIGKSLGHLAMRDSPINPIASARPGAGRFPLFALRGGNVPTRIALTPACIIALSAPQ